MSRGHRLWTAAALLLSILGSSAGTSAAEHGAVIVTPAGAHPWEKLAAREIQRYVFLRTGQLPPIAESLPQQGDAVLLRSDASQLRPQHYRLRTVRGDGRQVLHITGGDPQGTLFGAYRLAEHFGVRFYLHGDVVPDQRAAWTLPTLDETGAPLFELRGIQPFHDFPEGPDWWNADDYKAVLAQIVKLRMNFFGLHTYPEGRVGPEPLVWIGLPEDVAADGGVRFSYPARHFTTANETGAWGYRPGKTSDYSLGAAGLYDRDDFGPDYMRGAHPFTKQTVEQSNRLFQDMGRLLADVFGYARTVGIKTCLGTETPLTIPQALRERLAKAGKDPQDPAVARLLYEGMFRRIMKTHPLDYYWFWTPEGWTWQGANDTQVDATLADLRRAIEAARRVQASFTLGTCGWVLGPPQDRALFDRTLPKDMPLSCINRQVGFTPVEEGFARVRDRPKWAIPWMEDDGALIIPQLWAGRMRRDAADAHAYGCTGLMGIHWRTRILGPNVAALAHAAWEQPGKLEAAQKPRPRDLPVDDFYADWAQAEFGPAVADPLARLFARLDGGAQVQDGSGRKANLPRPSIWVNGPGGVAPDARPWSQVQGEYGFVDELAALRPRVEGAGQLERFDYWLSQFRYLRAVGRLNCLWGQFNAELAKVKAEQQRANQQQKTRDVLLPLRRQMLDAVVEIHQHLLASVTTWGGLGNVTNWQQHVLPLVFDESGKQLGQLAGDESLAEWRLPRTYAGEPRLFVPTVRTLASPHETTMRVKAIVLAAAPPRSVSLLSRAAGAERFERRDCQAVGRGVYAAELPLSGAALREYYVQATTAEGRELHWPPTAPAINQTVVSMP